LTLKVLMVFNEEVLAAQSSFTFQQYVSFVTTMMLMFGLTFQTPIVIFCLNRTGIVSLDAFRRSRRFAILAIVIIASVITPGGDLISLFSLSIPMYLLYELGILLSWIAERRAKSRRITQDA
ncbi:MAG: twin-arginine translocase subunit TatC, partial [Sedimentisphaerales bacterium]